MGITYSPDFKSDGPAAVGDVHYRRVRALADGIREARAQRDELRGALESLVAGVEDSVLRFLDQHELQLRSDMDAVLRARVDRARAALSKAKEGR